MNHATMTSTDSTPGTLRALGGIWRLTYPGFVSTRRLLTLAGLLALLALLTAQNIRFGSAMEFSRWTVSFYLAILLPAIAFLSAGGAIREDMKSIPVDYVLTRPLRRPVFVALRYLSQMVCLQLTSLLPLGVILTVGRFVEIDGLGIMLPRLIVAQVLAVAAFSGLGFLFGAFTTRYLVLGLMYGGLIEIGVGHIPTQISRLSISNHIRTIVEPVMFGIPGWHDPAGIGAAVGTILLFTLITVGGAAALFSIKEFTGSGTAEK